MNEEFEHPRLAAVYDALDPDRSDLEPYLDLAEGLGARRILDLGCGTGTLAVSLAARGLDVVGVDPASASLALARQKPGAQRVRWVHGDATAIDITGFDLVTMTANALMSVPGELGPTLRCVANALRPGGCFAAETRRPDARAWERWTREDTWHDAQLADGSRVAAWTEVAQLRWPEVDLLGTFAFADGDTLTSTLTLRYRTLAELSGALDTAGLAVHEVRDAPDRPGREWIVIARRGSSAQCGPIAARRKR